MRIIHHSKKNRQHQDYLRRWLQIGRYAGGRCVCCHERLLIMDRYDAVCCPNCNEWIDEKCGDPDCMFCGNRPDTPAEGLVFQKPTIDKCDFIKQYEKRQRGRMRCLRRWRQEWRQTPKPIRRVSQPSKPHPV